MNQQYDFEDDIQTQPLSDLPLSASIGEPIVRVNYEQKNLSSFNDAWKASVPAENDPSILDDLLLTAESEADIMAAGCVDCSWGPSVVNHNQTTTEDEDETDSLSDLPIEKDPGVKGGRGGVGRDVLVGGLGSDL